MKSHSVPNQASSVNVPKLLFVSCPKMALTIMLPVKVRCHNAKYNSRSMIWSSWLMLYRKRSKIQGLTFILWTNSDTKKLIRIFLTFYSGIRFLFVLQHSGRLDWRQWHFIPGSYWKIQMPSSFNIFFQKFGYIQQPCLKICENFQAEVFWIVKKCSVAVG